MAKTYKQGIFKPINPHKYVGDLHNIVYRSSWEYIFLKWCDSNKSVLTYSSEETIIPYKSPVDGQMHRYFVDFKIKIIDKDSNIQTYLVEIKPDIQTKPPIKGNKRKQTFINECNTYGVNSAKWNAAIEYAKDRQWKFIIFTEYHLGLKSKL